MELCTSHVSVLAKGRSPQTRYWLIGIFASIGELIFCESGMPCWIAEASTNALNVEPGWKPAELPYLCGHRVVQEGLPRRGVTAHRS